VFVPPTGASATEERAAAPTSTGVEEGPAPDVSAEQPVEVVPARPRVAAPTFVAPPSSDEEDLRLFD
jgi:hypothetical protein